MKGRETNQTGEIGHQFQLSSKLSGSKGGLSERSLETKETQLLGARNYDLVSQILEEESIGSTYRGLNRMVTEWSSDQNSRTTIVINC